MVWFKVDDNFAFHPKTIAATNAAIGLWVRAGSWCGANLTEGRLPAGLIGTLGGHKRDARKLVEVGLWDEVEGGYQFRNWAEFQPTKAQVDAEREANRIRQAEYRARKRNGVTPPVTNGATNSTPTRPDPTRPKEERKTPARKRATSLPADWTPTPEHTARAAQDGVDLQREHDKFRAWVEANDIKSKSWNGRFTQWIIQAAEYQQSRNGGRPANAPRPGESLWDLPATGTDR